MADIPRAGAGDDSVHTLGVQALAEHIRSRQLTAAQVTEAYLHRITRTEPRIQGYVSVLGDQARQQADEIDAALDRGDEVGPLAGIPVAIKDNICTAGVQTTAASKLLEGFEPPYDATVVERLRAAGAIVVGKTNMDEFAMGSSTENSGLFTTANPWDTTRVPGGSSGGSAAVVAARSAVAALGSDTGGSIRQPAALCGVTGMKPSYGLVSRYGLLAFASSLDQVGPLGRSASDCALVLDAIAGHDPRDATSSRTPPPRFADQLAACPERLDGVKLGIPTEYMEACTDPEVRALVEKAFDDLRAQGAEIHSVSLALTKYAIACYQVLATAEASSNLARYEGVHYGKRASGARDIGDLYSRTRSEGFGPEVKRRILLGTFVLSSGYYDAFYLKALKARTLLRNDLLGALEGIDALVCPTSPVTAFQKGERITDPLTMYAVDIFTVTANLAGVPAISAPCGQSRKGLPVGLQVMARPFEDLTALRVVDAFQRATDHHQRWPSMGESSDTAQGDT